MLTEAQRADDRCRRWASRHGYEFHGGKTDVTVLVREGLLEDKYIVRMSEVWWWGSGPDNLNRRDPRTYLAVLIGGVWILCVHNPPGGPEGAVYVTGGRNKPAWRESADAEREFPGPVAGDLNCHEHEAERHIGPTAMTRKPRGVDGVMHHGWHHVATHHVKGIPGHGAGVLVFTKE